MGNSYSPSSITQEAHWRCSWQKTKRNTTLPWRRWARRNQSKPSQDQGWVSTLDWDLWNVFCFSGDPRQLCLGSWPTRSSTWSSWSSSGWICSPWPSTTTASPRCGSSPSRTLTWASSASSPPSPSLKYSLYACITSKSRGIFLILLLLFYPFLVSLLIKFPIKFLNHAQTAILW